MARRLLEKDDGQSASRAAIDEASATAAAALLPMRETAAMDGNDDFDSAIGVAFDNFQSTSGTIGPNDPSDFFRYTATRTGQLRFDLRNVTQRSTFTLYDANRNVLGEVLATPNGSAIMGFNVTPGQLYYIRATTDAAVQMSYSLSPSFTPSDNNETFDTAQVLVQQPFSNVIATLNSVGAYDPTDYFRIVPTRSGDLRIALSGVSGNLDVTLYDGSRNIIAQGTGPSAVELITADVTAGQTYFVSVSPAPGQGLTSYSLRAGYLNDNNNSAATAETLTMGTAITRNVGDVVTNPVDYFTFRATNAGIARIDLRSSSGSPLSIVTPITVTDANGQQLTSSGNALRTEFSVVPNGVYTVRVEGPTFGLSYTLSPTLTPEVVTDGNDTFDTATRLPQSMLFRDRFVGAGDARDVYTFTPTVSGLQRISLDENSADADLKIYDSNRNLITQSRAVGLNDEELAFFVTAGQQYYAVVETVGGAQTRYDIDFRAVDRRPVQTETTDIPEPLISNPVLYLGGAFSATLQSATDADTFYLDVPEGEVYLVRVEGTATGAGSLSDPDLTLRNFQGQTLAQSVGNPGQNAELRVQGISGSSHIIRVNSGTGATGTYRVLVTRDPSNDFTGQPDVPGAINSQVRLDPSAPLRSSIGAAGDTDWFRFSTKAGESFSLALSGLSDASGVAGGFVLVLRNRDGVELRRASAGPDGAPSLTVDQAGDYWIEVTGNANAGTYTLGATPTVVIPTMPTTPTVPTTPITDPLDGFNFGLSELGSLNSMDPESGLAGRSVPTLPMNQTGSVFGSSDTTEYLIRPTASGTYRFEISGIGVSSINNFRLEIFNGSSSNITNSAFASVRLENNMIVGTLPALAGQEYLLRVSANGSSSGGNYRITSTNFGLGDNDNIASLITANQSWPLSLSSTVGGTDPHDIYRFVATEVGTARVTFNGATNLQVFNDVNLRRFFSEPNGLRPSAEEPNTLQFLTLPGQTYYLWVGGDSQTRSYSATTSFTALADTDNTFETAQSLIMDRNARQTTNWVGLSDAADYFRFTPTTNGRVTFSSGQSANSPATFSVYDQNRSLLYSTTWQAGANPSALWTYDVRSGQTYYVKMESTGTIQSSYSFFNFIDPTDANETFDTATVLTGASLTVENSIGSFDFVDFFSFTAAQSGALNVLLSGRGVGFGGVAGNIDLRLYDSNRVLLAEGRGPTAVEFITQAVIAGQTYFVEVLPPAGTTLTNYTLRTGTLNDTNNTADTAQALTLDTVHSDSIGDITVDPVDYFVLRPTQSGIVSATISGGGFSSLYSIASYNFSVLDAQQRVIADGGTSTFQSLRFAVEAGGTYYVRIAPDAEVRRGNYTLSTLLDPRGAADGNDTFETAVTNSLSVVYREGYVGGADREDYYTFTPTTTGTASVSLARYTSDIELRIYDNNRALVTQQRYTGSNPFGSGTLNFYTVAGTQYYAVVAAVGTKHAGYEIDFGRGNTPIQATEPADIAAFPGSPVTQAPALHPGHTFTAALGTATDSDYFRLLLPAGLRFRVVVEGVGADNERLADPDINIRSFSGVITQVAGNNGPRVETIVEGTAASALEVFSRTGATGTYRITVTAVPPTTAAASELPAELFAPPNPDVLSQFSAAIQAGQEPNPLAAAVAPQRRDVLTDVFAAPPGQFFMPT